MGSQHWTFNMYRIVLLLTLAIMGASCKSLDQSVDSDASRQLGENHIMYPKPEDKCYQMKIYSRSWRKYISGFRDGRANAKCDCDGNKQSWCIKPTNDALIQPASKSYMVTLINKDTHKYLRADPDGSISDTASAGLYYEEFYLEWQHSNQYCLKSHLTKKYLSAQPDGRLEVNRDKCSHWERFYLGQANEKSCFSENAFGCG